MIVRRFLPWAQGASAGQRAEAASALDRAYLYSNLLEVDRKDAEIALTALLDDSSPIVRRALAEAFASAREAPLPIVLALANDQSDVAMPVLGRSPLLGDADLIDCAAIGDVFAQSAIALRPDLSAAVAAALAEVGAREALISLAVNLSADLPDFSMRRMIERFGADGEMREALLSRPGLPATLRADLVTATANALSAFVIACDWMSDERAARAVREAREKATVIIAGDGDGQSPHGCLALARHLRQCGQLTAGLVLRSLLSGRRALFEAVLAELSGVAIERVAGHVRSFRQPGFAALYAKASLPVGLLPAFRAALAAQEEAGAVCDRETEAALSRVMVERVLTACSNLEDAQAHQLMALLRRFESEAAREEARRVAAEPHESPRVAIDLAALEAEILEAA
jgi:uncharacterized protein (DUF2336 family)